jgi:Ca2+-binding RTX toxin-like protein
VVTAKQNTYWAILRGGPGNDRLSGGGGSYVWVDYFKAPAPISVDLRAGTAIGEGSDVLTGIRHVFGSTFADTLLGNALPNRLAGSVGGDIIWGRDGNDLLRQNDDIDILHPTAKPDGNDTIRGQRGNDTLDGGPGDNANDGGEGTDTCMRPDPASGAVNCER